MGILNNNYRRRNRRRNRSKSSSMFHEKYPRLVVYRSNRHFEGQIINDFESKTLVSASSKDSSLKKEIDSSKSKTEVSIVVGKVIGKKAINVITALTISKPIFSTILAKSLQSSWILWDAPSTFASTDRQ